MTEIEQVYYDETIVDFNVLLETYGVARVLRDFRHSYPAMFKELTKQANHITMTPALLQVRHAGPS